MMQGHLTDVADVCWMRDDSRLVSVGGSNMYHWMAPTWARMPDQELCDKALVSTPFSMRDQ